MFTLDHFTYGNKQIVFICPKMLNPRYTPTAVSMIVMGHKNDSRTLEFTTKLYSLKTAHQ